MFLKHNYFLILLSCFPALLFAQIDYKRDYNVANIPLDLLKNANVVVREHDLKFAVKNKGEAMETEHKVITILNDKAEGYDEPVFGYGGISELDDIEAVIYDAEGKLVRKMKRKDIEDFKPYEQYVNDGRYKKIKFPRLAYPYTIEYTVKTRHNGLMHYPVFLPQGSPSEAVQNATFSLEMPADLKVRVKEINIPKGVKDNELHWTFNHIKAFKTEEFAPVSQEDLAKILPAPTDFKLEGFEGNMNTWNDYGAFLYKLNQDRNKLSPATIEKVKNLVADCKDDYCKIEKIYAMMQNSTRYFYVGLGIGGWQPAPATEVDNFKYGDCKGLSNYMVSMLNAVGVPARYVIIRAGDDNVESQYPDFPNAYFNHAIACVPMAKDTLWLECTSQTESCGFLSDFTDSRNALIVTPEGGKLVKTPKYNEISNSTVKKATIQLLNNGNATIETENTYSGIQQNIPSQLAEINADLRQKYLYKVLNISNFEIKNLIFERKKGRLPATLMKLKLEIPNLASVSGKRLFLPVNTLTKWNTIPTAMDSLRKSPVQADARGFSEIDEVSVILPEGYKNEGQFTPISITSLFGSYTLSASVENDKLLINRKLVINNSIQTKEKYNALIDFYKAIAKADKSKMVLIK
jgi:hypothetical protein